MDVGGFDFPDALFYLPLEQVWARVDADGTATVGITALGIHLAGEIYMCRPKGLGFAVEQSRSVAVVELAKSIVSVKSPVSGDVVEVNARLAQQPELVHTDPYGAGWLARLKLTRWDGDQAALVHGDTVPAAMADYQRLHRLGA
jgi:glycine cleavage system H protein